MHRLINGEPVPLSEEEEAEFLQREADHLAALEEQKLVAYKELRKKEYPPLEEVIVALMEKEEGRPEALDQIKVKRAFIKAKYPKPNA